MPSQFKCDKGHLFIHPAKATELHPADINGKIRADTVMESSVCPYCFSLDLELVEEQEPPVENVYIYDLTSGPQTQLDGLLAQGYKIKNRYAKQYHLEKCKPEADGDYVAEAMAKKQEATQ